MSGCKGLKQYSNNLLYLAYFDKYYVLKLPSGKRMTLVDDPESVRLRESLYLLPIKVPEEFC